MNKFFSRLSEVVWTSVMSLVFSVGAVVIALAGADTSIVTAASATGVALAILSPRQ